MSRNNILIKCFFHIGLYLIQYITKLHSIKALLYINYSHVYNKLLSHCKSWLSKFIPGFNLSNLFISNLFNYFYVL